MRITSKFVVWMLDVLRMVYTGINAFVLLNQDNILLKTIFLLLFAFQSMFISIWVSRLELAEFPDSVRRSAP